MTAKEYLWGLQRLDAKISQKMAELDGLRATYMGIGGMDYSGPRVQSSPGGDAPFVKTVERIAALSAEIDAEIDRYVDERHRIINQIQGLPDEKHMQVLFKRYVEFKRLEEVAVEMNYSYQHARRVHGYALQDFERAYLRKK